MVTRNVLIALGGFALLAGLALVMLWSRHAPVVRDASNAAEPRSLVLVAARQISAGTLLRREDMTWKGGGPDAVPGSISSGAADARDYIGGVTRRAFDTGQPLIDASVIKVSDRNFLSAVLSPGDRAVAIAVDAPESVAGLVIPGDRVDILLTQSVGAEPGDRGHGSVSETVLRDIRVIAVDQWLDTVAKPIAKEQRIGASGSPIPGTITLEVGDHEAERMLVAQQIGKITLAVRALERSGEAVSGIEPLPQPIWAVDVSPALGGLGPNTVTVGVPPGRSPMDSSIEIMHGSKTDIR